MLCTECHTSNAADYKFCRECGKRLPAPPADGTPQAQVEQCLARAFTQVEQRSFVEAEASVQAALAIDPDSTSAHSVLALIYERQGRVPEAIRELELVVAANPAGTVDRARLEALRGHSTTSFRRSRWTPQQITTISAVAAGIAVFGGGIAIINAQNGKGTPETNNTGTLQPIRSASAPPLSGADGTAAGAPASGKIQSLTPLPTPPTPLSSRPSGFMGPLPPPAATGPGIPQVKATPLLTAPQRSRTPLLPAPRPGNTAQNASGLPAAGIGEVVPLPQAPATAPGTAPAPGTPVPAGPAVAANGSPAPAAPVEPAKPVDSAAEKPKKELLEPETGFIKIEPIGGATKESRAPVTAPKGPPPTISVDFVVGGGDEPSLEDAQRAQRSAQSAEKRLANSEAERQYRRAAELFELLARRGGSTAKQAREGLEACRKALASLR